MVRSSNSLYVSILKTLCYSDVFDYPLSKKELFTYLISRKKFSQNDVFSILEGRIPIVGRSGSYYFLKGRAKIVAIRKKRMHESKKKMEKAKRVAQFLSFIPSVKFIGVSGSLSMNNSSVDDDIDFFIITSKKRLWTTRLLVLFALLIFGGRRRQESFARDKVCANMFISEENLLIKDKNIFIAHEITQVKPLVNKDYVYERFVKENIWVKKFLPNAISVEFKPFMNGEKEPLFGRILNRVEPLFFALQYLYMSQNITNEIVRRDTARFHPRDKKTYVIELYKLKYKAILRLISSRKALHYSRILT